MLFLIERRSLRAFGYCKLSYLQLGLQQAAEFFDMEHDVVVISQLGAKALFRVKLLHYINCQAQEVEFEDYQHYLVNRCVPKNHLKNLKAGIQDQIIRPKKLGK